jgi:NADP-dependent 3-hydroxy acid dehydrogenase YdfG
MLTLADATGAVLVLQGRRAAALAALAVALLRRPHLEESDVWDAAVHVYPGKVVTKFGDSDLPTAFAPR